MSFAPDKELRDDDYCFACGKENPSGLRMLVEYTDSEALCRLTLERRFQGWSGMAHGGVVSTLLDEIMAHAVIKFVGQAVTASMETKYKAPVPLGRELLVRGWVTDKNSRLAHTQAEVSLASEGKLLALGKAKFMLTPNSGGRA